MSQKLTTGVKKTNLKKENNFYFISINIFSSLSLYYKKLKINTFRQARDKDWNFHFMGCCQSLCPDEQNPLRKDGAQPPQPAQTRHGGATTAGGLDNGGDGGGIPSFSEFSLADLKAATNNFSSDNIVSESGEKAPNLVYKGRLQNRRWIAVKKFTKMAWPHPKQFAVPKKKENTLLQWFNSF